MHCCLEMRLCQMLAVGMPRKHRWSEISCGGVRADPTTFAVGCRQQRQKYAFGLNAQGGSINAGGWLESDKSASVPPNPNHVSPGIIRLHPGKGPFIGVSVIAGSPHEIEPAPHGIVPMRRTGKARTGGDALCTGMRQQDDRAVDFDCEAPKHRYERINLSAFHLIAAV